MSRAYSMRNLLNQKITFIYSGLGIAARLKALGVESVILERNAQIGDNWGNRYDSLSFHIPTSVCEMPYTRKP